MDPLSIIAGVTGTVAVALHSSRHLRDEIDSIRDAPKDLRIISNDAGEIANTLVRPNYASNPAGIYRVYCLLLGHRLVTFV